MAGHIHEPVNRRVVPMGLAGTDKRAIAIFVSFDVDDAFVFP